MDTTNNNFCFCTLALGKKYRLLAKQLSQDLEKHSPGTFLVVGTEKPNFFQSSANVYAFPFKQKGILHCYHDKRFVLEKALSQYPTAIAIDADTRIIDKVPTHIEWMPGFTGCSRNIIEHVQRRNPERLPTLEILANKLNLSLDNVSWVGESLMIVSKDNGKETDFFQQWGKIGDYLELQGIHAGSGNAIGLAAAKIGWTVHAQGWDELRNVTKHLDAAYQKKSVSLWDNLERRLGYHYRLNISRVKALKDFDFYYK
ncbi:MAG: hypothetical protein RIG63_23110 [Coleofasciculus chthonoplastes F3-SA18-01]|uniref:hypothetical protein n=1 Tax=Coleofasciculus chthonoplastes TaxID=64178 RepID=UPI003304DC34